MRIRGRVLTALVLAVLAVVVAGGTQNTDTGSRKIELAAVGDVFFARGVAKQIADHGDRYPFEKTRDILKSADITFCNLECTLSKRGFPQRRRYLFRVDPKLAGVMRENGITVASLANNHTLDFGREPMLDTVESVRKAGMTAVGAGVDRNDALRVRVVKKNGLRVGFIAYSDIPSMGVVRLDDRPTIAGVNTDEIPAQVKAAKAQCDVLVVSFHWGIEYMRIPTERQKKLAHLCVDNGADLVLGHHPHVLQTTEVYKDKPIIYSMGGFVWDGYLPGCEKSAIYLFDLGPSSARLKKTIPIKITACQPSPINVASASQ